MKNRANIAVGIAAGIGVILLLVFAGSPHAVRRMKAGFLGLITPFLKSGSSVEGKYTAFREGLRTLDALEKDVTLLRISNKELSATNQTLRGLEAENNRLRTALRYRERATFHLVPAQIIARDASTWYNTVTIDRGKADGITEDMAVITEEGLVGKTTAIADHSSTVALISDETCKVAVSIEGTREQGISQGERASSGSLPAIVLNFLSKQAKLESGQKVMTSGVGGVFPQGIVLGGVKEFKVRELDGSAIIIPAVDLTTLQDVFVVTSEKK